MNTLEIAKKFEALDFPPQQAAGLASALYEREQQHLATKEDVEGVEQRLDTKIASVEYRLDTKIEGVEQRLDTKIDGVKKDLEGVEQRLEAKIESVIAKIQPIYWLMGFLVTTNIAILLKLVIN